MTPKIDQDPEVNEIIADSLLESLELSNGEDLHHFDIMEAANNIQTVMFMVIPLWEVTKFVWKTRHPEAVKEIIKIAKDNGIGLTEAAVNLMLKKIFEKKGKKFPPYLI